LPVIILAIPTAVNAQASASAVERFTECTAIEVDADRLACFDRVTKEIRASAAAEAGQEVAEKRARARSDREDFGLNVVQVDKKRPVEAASKLKELTVKVASSRRFGAGYYAILLEDGAVWQMAELDPYFRPPARGDTIRIKRGMMGGYLLYAGGQPSVRIRRVS
jgi:hypothetical protein